MALKKKKLGERIGGGLLTLKGVQDQNQIFSIVSDEIFSYDYHYDDIYQQLGRFMCMSEFDENGKIVKKAKCCQVFKKKNDRVVLPVIHYEGKKKNYRKMAEGKIKMLSLTSFKYNDLCKQLDEAGATFEDCNVDIVLKCEDEKRGKISFDIIDSSEDALWKTDKTMIDQVNEALETWEEDVIATLPSEYSPEEFDRLIEEAKESGSAPEGVEKPEAEKESIPKKKKSKEKVEKDLDEDDLDDDEEEEDETPKKKKKPIKEQVKIDEEDLDDLDEDEEEESEDEDDLDDDEEEEDETPKKKSKKKSSEEDEDDEDEDDDE